MPVHVVSGHHHLTSTDNMVDCVFRLFCDGMDEFAVTVESFLGTEKMAIILFDVTSQGYYCSAMHSFQLKKSPPIILAWELESLYCCPRVMQSS